MVNPRNSKRKSVNFKCFNSDLFKLYSDQKHIVRCSVLLQERQSSHAQIVEALGSASHTKPNPCSGLTGTPVNKEASTQTHPHKIARTACKCCDWLCSEVEEEGRAIICTVCTHTAQLEYTCRPLWSCQPLSRDKTRVTCPLNIYILNSQLFLTVSDGFSASKPAVWKHSLKTRGGFRELWEGVWCFRESSKKGCYNVFNLIRQKACCSPPFRCRAMWCPRIVLPKCVWCKYWPYLSLWWAPSPPHFLCLWFGPPGLWWSH